jgi:TolB-like protein/class 3 adenylate cyclase/Flp pilus assembly protein TadD
VTFLFTDIEGSTRLWATQHDAMKASLARHDALLRQCIEARGGFVFKTGGDAFCAAFPTAGSALDAALAAQRALRAEPWPEQAVIRVRMALHTGAAELRGGDYFGPPLNHVARLLAAGHGGQTLLSEITHDLCRDRLPAETALRSLGEHNLRDLARRETVFQLCHPDLLQAFPPLTTVLAPVDENAPSIAVLPFTDLSPERDQEYFTDGLADELLNVLTKIRGLRVASRTSAFHFKGKDVDIPTIAQRLNVATILEGSVRKAGKRVRVTAQLIQVATDSHLWSESYDRELEDIFAVQDDIAQSVVNELRGALLKEMPGASLGTAMTADVLAAAKEGRSENVEAYRLYLQGRFFEDRFTEEETARSLDYYRQALQVDPQYALAWAGLSRCYGTQAGAGWLPIAEGFGNAAQAAQRAVQLGPDLAEAHAALGEVRLWGNWDWDAAKASLHRALELAPGNARIMRNVAVLMATRGRLAEAIALLCQAAALDPLAAPVHRSLARWCYAAGRFEEAEAAIGKLLEVDPQSGRAHHILGLVRLAQGRRDEAMKAFQRESHESFRLLGIALAEYACGRDAGSLAALHELIERYGVGSAFQIAEAYAFRGERDLAFEWLERAYAQRDPGVVHTKVSSLLANLRIDPRWQTFLQKMRLAD